MATVTLDTLKFVETLKEAGVPEIQAKAFSTAVRESHEAAELATKGDIAELRHEMRELASALRQDIADRHYEMDAKFEKRCQYFDKKYQAQSLSF